MKNNEKGSAVRIWHKKHREKLRIKTFGFSELNAIQHLRNKYAFRLSAPRIFLKSNFNSKIQIHIELVSLQKYLVGAHFFIFYSKSEYEITPPRMSPFRLIMHGVTFFLQLINLIKSYNDHKQCRAACKELTLKLYVENEWSEVPEELGNHVPNFPLSSMPKTREP